MVDQVTRVITLVGPVAASGTGVYKTRWSKLGLHDLLNLYICREGAYVAPQVGNVIDANGIAYRGTNWADGTGN